MATERLIFSFSGDNEPTVTDIAQSFIVRPDPVRSEIALKEQIAISVDLDDDFMGVIGIDPVALVEETTEREGRGNCFVRGRIITLTKIMFKVLLELIDFAILSER